MSSAGLALNLMFVAMISATSFYHFDRREREPLGATLLSLATVAGAFANTVEWWFFGSPSTFEGTIAVAMTILAGVIFAVTASASRGSGLFRVFSTRTPPDIVESGIYAYVRHPFYLSYMIYWWGWCPLNSFHPISLTVAALMTITYAAASRVEEGLLTSKFGERYISYSQRTKRFLPLLF